jgi:hypothetical protein
MLAASIEPLPNERMDRGDRNQWGTGSYTPYIHKEITSKESKYRIIASSIRVTNAKSTARCQ